MTGFLPVQKQRLQFRPGFPKCPATKFMKQTVLTLIFGLSTAAMSLAQTPAPSGSSDAASTNQFAPFNDERQRASYAFGMYTGHQMQQAGADIDLELFTRGFKDAQTGGQMLLTPQQMQEALKEFQKSVMARQQQAREQLAAKNKKEGEEFLATHKKKPGVKTLPDGLQYTVITEGKGPKPGSNDVAVVNYRGTLVDGTEFDSTAKVGHPAQFPLTQIIPGWREALQMMPAGSVWELVVPSDLAYGETGHPPQIPPNSVLIFSIQLVSSTTPGAPQPASNAQPLTSDIIAVPSAEELKKGKQPYTLKPEQVQKLQKQMQSSNAPAR